MDNNKEKNPEQKQKGLHLDEKTKLLRAWYAVHTYSGYEDAVARYLKQRVESLSMNDKIFNIIVPKEKKIRVKNGKKKITEEKIYPGYVLVDMILNEDSWYVVRNTPRVMGFVGPDSTKPTPLSKGEIEFLMSKIEGEQETKFKVEYTVGDLIRVVDGPFRDYEGKITEIDEEHGRVRVSVPVFGRETVVEIDSLQIQKI